MMNILNIHGFEHTRNNSSYQSLKSTRHEITQLDLEYDNYAIEATYEILSCVILSKQIDLIVSNSFGSFFAKRLGYQHNIPNIFVNPCFSPDTQLLPIHPEYYTLNRMSTINAWKHELFNWSFVNDIVIYSDNDEFIDHEKTTKSIAKDAKFIKLSNCSHYIKLSDNFTHILAAAVDMQEQLIKERGSEDD